MSATWRRAETALAIALALVPTLQQASAQEPQLKPLSEHLVEIEQDPVGVLRYAYRRCAALHLLVSEVSRPNSPDIGATYFDTATDFLAGAARADELLGTTAELALESTRIAVADILELYRERFRHSMAVTGNYFVDDALVTGDIELCNSLAEPTSQAPLPSR